MCKKLIGGNDSIKSKPNNIHFFFFFIFPGIFGAKKTTLAAVVGGILHSYALGKIVLVFPM